MASGRGISGLARLSARPSKKTEALRRSTYAGISNRGHTGFDLTQERQLNDVRRRLSLHKSLSPGCRQPPLHGMRTLSRRDRSVAGGQRPRQASNRSQGRRKIACDQIDATRPDFLSQGCQPVPIREGLKAQCFSVAFPCLSETIWGALCASRNECRSCPFASRGPQRSCASGIATRYCSTEELRISWVI